MADKFPEPSTRICPKCRNSTLIFMGFRRIWQCSHMEGSIVCGYTEPYDSVQAILRGITYYLGYIEAYEDDIGICTEISRIKEKCDEVLARKDDMILHRDELEA